MVRIRMRRVGGKGQASFRIVAADKESPRDGRFIEILGFYNPRTEPSTINLKEDRIYDWMSKGAQPSDSALQVFQTAGLLERYERFKKGEAIEKLIAEADEASVARNVSPRTQHPIPVSKPKKKEVVKKVAAVEPEAAEAEAPAKAEDAKETPEAEESKDEAKAKESKEEPKAETKDEKKEDAKAEESKEEPKAETKDQKKEDAKAEEVKEAPEAEKSKDDAKAKKKPKAEESKKKPAAKKAKKEPKAEAKSEEKTDKKEEKPKAKKKAPAKDKKEK